MSGAVLSPAKPFGAADFATRAGCARYPSDAEDGDFAFNPDIKEVLRARATREAAVLIGVIERGGEGHVLLTKRTQALRTHSGQVALPGGRIDAEDGSARAAAVRECEEETGIAPHHIRPVGELPIYLSGSGYRIHPVLAVIEGEPAMTPNPHEVEDLFEVPLSFLMDRLNHRLGSRVWQGRRRYYYEMPYGEHYIWGVTAGIIRSAYERLYA